MLIDIKRRMSWPKRRSSSAVGDVGRAKRQLTDYVPATTVVDDLHFGDHCWTTNSTAIGMNFGQPAAKWQTHY